MLGSGNTGKTGTVHIPMAAHGLTNNYVDNNCINAEIPPYIHNEEDDNNYIYKFPYPGLSKKDIRIEEIKEKDFLSFNITIVNKEYLKTAPWLRTQEEIRIAKPIEMIDESIVASIDMQNGLLIIKIQKKFLIVRTILNF